MFSSGKCTWSQVNYFIHSKYNTFYGHWNSFHNKKSHDFLSLLFFPLILLFTSSCSLTVYIHSVYMALETELYFPDSFLLLSLKIKRPLLARCSNHHAYYFLKNSLKMLVIIQCLWLRHGTMSKGWIWKKIELKITWSSANTVVELWC